MRLLQCLTSLFMQPSNPPSAPIDEGPRINPATGLPMITPGIGSVDVGGNPFGHDLDRRDDHRDHHHHSSGSADFGFGHWSNNGASGFDQTRGY